MLIKLLHKRKEYINTCKIFWILFLSSLNALMISLRIVSADGVLTLGYNKQNIFLRCSPSITVKGWSSQTIHFIRNSRNSVVV
jgi:hypothetical protein